MLLYTIWFSLFPTPGLKVSEEVMNLGLFILWFFPFAFASVVFGAFAKGYRRMCLLVSAVYFVGVIVMVLAF